MKALTTIDTCGAWLVSALLWKHVMTTFYHVCSSILPVLLHAGSYCPTRAVAVLVSKQQNQCI